MKAAEKEVREIELEVMKKLIKRYQAEHRQQAKEAAKAERYYRKKNDILKRVRKQSADNTPLRNADNRVPSNLYNVLVNQKASYLFTTPPSFDTGNQSANKKIMEILGDNYFKTCKSLCVKASNCVVAWLHYWEDDKGKFKYAVVDSKQIIPIFTNDLEKELSGLLRMYDKTQEDGNMYNIYEYWDKEYCYLFHKENKSPVNDLKVYGGFQMSGDIPGIFEESNTLPHDFGEVPFIPFYNNEEMGNDLNDIKELIDTYDKVYSDFVNDLEDIQEVIFVLSGYDGERLAPFLENIKKYKAIKVNGEDNGSVNTLTIEIPVEARKEMLAITRQSIFEQGMGIDPDPQNFGNSSGVALSYLYSLLELKAGLMETEFRTGFGRLVRAICRHAGIQADVINQTWTRTSVSNGVELAAIAKDSIGVISRKTIIKNHPWVEDPEKELEQLEAEEREEEKKQDSYVQAFQNKIPASKEDGGITDEE